MLDRNLDFRQSSGRRNNRSEDETPWSLQEIRIILRKYVSTILVGAGVFFLLGVLYTASATRQYTAVARLLIDTPRNPISSLETANGSGGGSLQIPEVESQLQVITSDRLGLKVLERMQGEANPAGATKEPSLITHLGSVARSIFHSLTSILSDKPGEPEPQQAALNEIMAGLNVRRVGSSYVVEISYTSTNPQRSADLANAFAQAYVEDEVDTKSQIWRRASVWLQDRVNELRLRSEEAARAAQDFKAQNGNNAETWPKARELDRQAEAYDALYSAFLKRYTDSVQQQTFPVSQARIIGEASRPVLPSFPRTGIVVTLMTLIGAGLGTATAFIRWRLDRTIRSPAQIARYGIRCLATLPRLPKVISRDQAQVVRTVLRAPRSQFSENLRLVRAEISIAERQRPMRYIGITSAVSGEGKTTVSSNLAQLFAPAGQTLLVDADMRNPQLTLALMPILTPRALTPQPGKTTSHIVSVPGCPSLDFLGVDSDMQFNGSSWFEQGGFEAMLEENKQKYERIIIDLPPASVVAEARYVAPLLDAIIVVAEWEATTAEALMSCIEACDVDPGKVFGVILNKAHSSVLTRGQGSTYTNNYFDPEDPSPVDLRKGRIRV